MNKDIKEDELDKLLEEELIREADMIEKSLLADGDDEFSVSKEDIRRSYSRLLKRAKEEGILTEENMIQTAEIVKFPGNCGKTEISDDEKNPDKEHSNIAGKDEEKIPLEEMPDLFSDFKIEKKSSWGALGKAAGFILLLAFSLLAGSMAGKASRENFVSTIEYVMNHETDTAFSR